MNITKNGVIAYPNIYESNGCDVLENSYKYTNENPFVLTGTTSDIYVSTDMYAKVIPGETYYYTVETDSTWAPYHAGNTGTVICWLYLCNTYDPSNDWYDTPISFGSSSWINRGVWKYTIPPGYNMARVRFNTYNGSGSGTVTAKFWDTHLIPEKYYTNPNIGIGMKVTKDSISAQNIIEF